MVKPLQKFQKKQFTLNEENDPLKRHDHKS